MWLFNLFQKGSKANKGIFVKKNEYKRNLTLQKKMSIKTIQQLENSLNGQVDRLNLEFFFYTNNQQKAEKLQEALLSIGYFSKIQKVSNEESVHLITGWSSKILLSRNVILAWVTEMCEIGFRNDCDFDGWGASGEENLGLETK